MFIRHATLPFNVILQRVRIVVLWEIQCSKFNIKQHPQFMCFNLIFFFFPRKSFNQILISVASGETHTCPRREQWLKCLLSVYQEKLELMQSIQQPCNKSINHNLINYAKLTISKFNRIKTTTPKWPSSKMYTAKKMNNIAFMKGKSIAGLWNETAWVLPSHVLRTLTTECTICLC